MTPVRVETVDISTPRPELHASCDTLELLKQLEELQFAVVEFRLINPFSFQRKLRI
jgi:hypothetical protein